jgi:uncharacterized protein (TIGR00251 family)
MMECLKPHPQGTLLTLYVQPRSSRNQIVGLFGESLKVKLTSPPVDGAANKCCTEYLAKLLGLAKSQVQLVAGDKARQKRFLLCGVKPLDVEVIIHAQLGES